ncbi:hypothetical protein [Photobacterium gaetbulicola]|uniref:hypothetical protein n=1 Tax=Photobacterium gaetbulicola TaxID=1295392 RepID=UPI000B1F694B|nr:hypothetical protein [Photobacterium gaetbulicola]
MNQSMLFPFRLSVLSNTTTHLLFVILLKICLFFDELEAFDQEAKAIRREDRKSNI